MYVRDLTAADLSDIGASPNAVVRPLARIRNTHHQLAKLLAEGRKQVECAAITGYAQSTISILLHDPAFQELLAYYTTQKEAVYLDVHQRLAQLGLTAVEELQERLELSPEKFSNEMLNKIMESTMDRSVAPARGSPQGAGGGTNVAVTVEFITPPPPAPKIIEHDAKETQESEEE